MYLKIHESAGQRIVAACDAELIGRVLEAGGRVLDLDRYRGFYAGSRATAGEIAEALGSFTSANLVGRKTVKVALERGLASDDDVMYIKGIPYIQIYRI